MTLTEHRHFIRKNALHLLDYLVIDQHGPEPAPRLV